MNSKVEQAAAAYIAPKFLGNFKFKWLIYGAAAYYGLKLLNKRGIFPDQTGAALKLIDRGIDVAKQRIGLSGNANVDYKNQAALAH